jgi:integrase
MRRTRRRAYGPYEHGNQWRVHIVETSGGKRKTRYENFGSRAEAEACVAGARDEAQGATVKQAVDAFLAAMRADGCKEPTLETAEYRLRHILGLPRNNERPLRWLRMRGGELYAAAQIDRAPDTHQNELAKAKELGEFCVAKRWLHANPFAKVEPVGRKTHGADKPRLTVDESRKLRAHCHAMGSDPAAVITLAYLLLGPRASELVRRDIRDLDDGGALLWIRKTKTKAGSRRLVIPAELVPLMLDLAHGRPSDAPLFVNEDGERCTRYWAYYHVRRICGDAKVPVLPPQALRRTQADLATDAGMAGVEVSRHLGHEVAGAPAVTGRSYVSRNANRDAQAERAFRVIDGGRSS